LLLDNAYGEFCRFDYSPLLARFQNLVLFRTFSKAWSLAGLRLGYLLADPALVAEIVKLKLPYNLGHAAAIAGELALESAALVERRVALVRARRAQWAARLKRSFSEVFPSEANFVLVRDEKRRARTMRWLLERSIRVRDVSGGSGLAGCLRFTVGNGAALRAVDTTLTESMSEQEPG
jgi:histidinol-phosphate aminotransferase